MDMFERVIVAVARSDTDTDLLRYAGMVAALAPEAEFHFVHVLDWPGRATRETAPITHDQARQQLSAAVAAHFGDHPRTFCRVLHGVRVDRLLETAAETAADALLVGHRKDRSGRRALARRLAMKAPCSIWMAPEGSRPEIRRVVAAVDFSDPSAHALMLATEIARQTGAHECLALHVYNDDSEGVDGYPLRLRGREQETFARFLGPLDLHGVAVRPVFEEHESVSRAVARLVAATSADLVVMGTRGCSRSTSILLGSESEQTIVETRVPVLVVKRRGERIGLLEVLLDRGFKVQQGQGFG